MSLKVAGCSGEAVPSTVTVNNTVRLESQQPARMQSPKHTTESTAVAAIMRTSNVRVLPFSSSLQESVPVMQSIALTHVSKTDLFVLECVNEVGPSREKEVPKLYQALPSKFDQPDARA
jgi:hypothetical protein